MNQNAKQRLESIRRAEVIIERKKTELEMLRAEAAGISRVQYDGIRVQSSGSSDKMGQAVATYVDIEREIESDMAELAKTRHAVIDQINGMERQDYATLLFKRYVEHKSLKIISEEMRYDYGYMRTMHGKAIQAFERRYGVVE